MVFERLSGKRAMRGSAGRHRDVLAIEQAVLVKLEQMRIVKSK